MYGVLETLAAHLRDNAASLWWGFLIQPHFRLYWPWVVVFVVLGSLVWWRSEALDSGRSLRGLASYLFPKDTYLHPSARTDYVLFAANALLFAGLGTLGAYVVARTAFAVSLDLTLRFRGGVDAFGWTTPATAAFTVVAVVLSDFSAYVVHAVHHRVPTLWHFHKVHHTAEVLTPVTVYRKHPLYDLWSTLVRAVLTGALQGVAAFAFIGRPEPFTLFGINVFYFWFHAAGSNLRHSHIWLSFPGWLGAVFVSPAQHQIHHSVAPEHQNKNFGEVFSFWDRLFGTLYVPEGREALTYGVPDTPASEHASLWKAYARPFADALGLRRD